jgi:hypothetical protein
MEPSLPITTLPATRTDARDLDLIEVDAAIELVRLGSSSRVRLVGLRDPAVVAAIAVAHGQAAGIAVALERDGRHVAIVITRHP